MLHSQDRSIPLTEFSVMTNDEFSFLDDSEDFVIMAFLCFSPMNTIHAMEDKLILATDHCSEVDSLLPKKTMIGLQSI